MEAEKPKFFVDDKGVVYVAQETEYTQYLQKLRNEDQPIPLGQAQLCAWRKSKIPYALWVQIRDFLQWTQAVKRSEGMVTLYTNQLFTEWRAHAYPQKGQGLHVELKQDTPEYREQRALFGDEWVEFGSVHHHCTASAFQSGVDSADETDREGIHITIGNLDKPLLSWHARIVIDGIQVNGIRVSDVIEPVANYPEIVEMLTQSALTIKEKETAEGLAARVPELWRKNFSLETPMSQYQRDQRKTYPSLQYGKDFGPNHVHKTYWEAVQAKEAEEELAKAQAGKEELANIQREAALKKERYEKYSPTMAILRRIAASRNMSMSTMEITLWEGDGEDHFALLADIRSKGIDGSIAIEALEYFRSEFKPGQLYLEHS